MYSILNGDNLDLLDRLKDNSVDSVVTDGPYGLKFMNKKWDYDVPSVDFWKKVYRVLKPGGHILSFGGTRTYHRMVVNLEDAGFEIRDCISWIYGSGFPKSLNIGKNYDKKMGNEREVVGSLKNKYDIRGTDFWANGKDEKYIDVDITKGQSEYEGLGTALKPAQELICLARKPLSESSIVENVIKWGTGGLNIDGCRIGYNNDKPKETYCKRDKNNLTGWGTIGTIADREENWVPNTEGRFPANIILECICDEVIKGEMGKIVKSKGRNRENHNYNSVGNMGSYDGGDTIDNYNDKGDIHTNPECPCRMMDEQSGFLKGDSPNRKPRVGGHRPEYVGTDNNSPKKTIESSTIFDSGGASRFFYQAKVSKKERNLGLDLFEDKLKNTIEVSMADGKIPENFKRFSSIQKNIHPTCKPINLLTYLCKLITPKGGLILDPYMGSGSTGIASQLEGFNFIGFELDPEYFKIAEERIGHWEEYKKIIKEN